jgi:hypothetical protein
MRRNKHRGEQKARMPMATEDRHFPFEQVSDERLRQAVQILTTEHFTLQSARSNAIAETNGRLAIYLGTLSSALIALAFVGQISGLGEAFRVFALILLPAILVLGLATAGRLVQSNRQDLLYGVGINRVRHFYVELVPELGDYFVQSVHDDFEGGLQSMGLLPRAHMQQWVSVSVLVAALNALVAGVLAGLLITWVGALPLPMGAVGGVAVGFIVLQVEAALGSRAISRFQRFVTPRFPSPPPPSRRSQTAAARPAQP